MPQELTTSRSIRFFHPTTQLSVADITLHHNVHGRTMIPEFQGLSNIVPQEEEDPSRKPCDREANEEG